MSIPSSVGTEGYVTSDAEETITAAPVSETTVVLSESVGTVAAVSAPETFTGEIPAERTEAETTSGAGTLAVRLDELCGSSGADAVQAAFIDREGTIYRYCFGFADYSEGRRVGPDTKYRVASLSKLVTDLVFMRLEEDGVVDRSADVGDYLGYAVRNPSFPDVPITAHMLMSHTSSLKDSQRFLDSRLNQSSVPMADLLSGSFSYADRAPGSAYEYSNFGVAVVGAVCEKATGQFFQSLAEKYVFSPLGIDAAYCASMLRDSGDVGALYGAGSMSVSAQLDLRFSSEPGQTHHLTQGNLTISAKDYARILHAVLNGGVSADGIRLVGEEAADAMLTPAFFDGSEGVGYGTFIKSGILGSGECFYHTGSNFGMYAAYVADKETGGAYVVLTSGAPYELDGRTGIYRLCMDVIREMHDFFN